MSGSGWQGPGNGEAPGDLWNPAVATNTCVFWFCVVCVVVCVLGVLPLSACASVCLYARCHEFVCCVLLLLLLLCMLSLL